MRVGQDSHKMKTFLFSGDDCGASQYVEYRDKEVTEPRNRKVSKLVSARKNVHGLKETG